MVNVDGFDNIPNLSKIVEDTIESLDVYGTHVYNDEDSVEE